MSSNAAKEWSLRASCPLATFVHPCTSSGTFKELKHKRDKIKRQIKYHITEHKKLDKNESRDEERRARSEQAIETLTKAHEKIDQYLKSNSPRMGQGKQKREVKSNITDNESAKMTTSKGTIQGYTGIAAVDKKRQVIVDAQAFGGGQEHHTLQPVLISVQERFKRLSIKLDDSIFTADTGYACEANMKYLHENNINGYIPDHNFRQRDPKFNKQKENHGKRNPITGKARVNAGARVIPSSVFDFDPMNKTCVYLAKESMGLRSERVDRLGHKKIFFEGRIIKCRACKKKRRCMNNPESANDRKGHGRQVSFIIKKGKRAPNYTD